MQRVHRAEVSVGGQVVGRCGTGLMIAVGIAVDDTDADVRTLVDKFASFAYSVMMRVSLTFLFVMSAVKLL